jgi:uncharacterized protein (TIGR02453 family)
VTFPPATLEFLADLREHNTREWFDFQRSRYEKDVLAPAKAVVTALAPVLDRLSPGIHAEPRVLGSIFRINRDTRFSADKRPYKDHLDFWFWHGPRATAVSGLFLRLSPDGLSVGAGAHGLDKDRLHRYRTAVGDPVAGTALVDLAADLERSGIGIAGQALVRPPKGYEAAPEAAPFLLHKALFVATTDPAESATDPTLPQLLERRWAPLVPLHEWLVEHVQDAPGD